MEEEKGERRVEKATSETPLTLTEAVVKEIGRSVNFFTVGVDQTQCRVGLRVVTVPHRSVSS